MKQSEINKMLVGAGVAAGRIPANLAETMEKYGVITLEDSKRFLANCLNETGGFTRFAENGNYTTPRRLQEVFPSAFGRPGMTGKNNPAEYLRNEKKLFNLVYDDRKFKKGLGNLFDGDGWNFKGRGAIQVTGRNNYTMLSKRTGIDFVGNPQWLESDQYKFVSALDFWKTHKLSEKPSLLATRQVIAGNYSLNPFGYEEVKKWYNKLK
ncbi:glycoside hydrolase family 19 protein [uncultured Chryseobacterium sp.]|uniref:glycoside hydrolase family 19 protein n=1 Tax=uncultured Chryseobacterium sp. TaxID=259322 RepID=UPI0025DE0FDE|nr:glycoside hydrolase family 19 protein [uncultured Chryseobacterium sp.]